MTIRAFAERCIRRWLAGITPHRLGSARSCIILVSTASPQSRADGQRVGTVCVSAGELLTRGVPTRVLPAAICATTAAPPLTGARTAFPQVEEKPRSVDTSLPLQTNKADRRRAVPRNGFGGHARPRVRGSQPRRLTIPYGEVCQREELIWRLMRFDKHGPAGSDHFTTTTTRTAVGANGREMSTVGFIRAVAGLACRHSTAARPTVYVRCGSHANLRGASAAAGP